MKLYLPFISLLVEFSSCQTVETEHYLIPQGFTGRVEIIFDQKKGVPIKYEQNRCRVYEIPQDGILLTQFHYEGGWIKHHFYYVDSKGSRTPLTIFEDKYFDDSAKVTDRNKIGVFSDGTSGQYSKKSARFEFFFVSSKNGFDTIESYEHFNKRVESILDLL